jgi:membrane protease YdiL (CAAX protease family)
MTEVARGLGYGAALGLAEAVLASFLFGLAANALSTARPASGVPAGFGGWLVLAHDGWAAPWRRIAGAVPPPAALALVVAAVAAEEAVLRGVVVPALARADAVAAVLLTMLVAVTVRVAAVRPWPRAVHPAAYGAVVGTAHGWLYLQTGDLVPLVAAQLVIIAFVVAR